MTTVMRVTPATVPPAPITQSSRRRQVALFGTPIALVLMLGACGGDDDPEESSGADTTLDSATNPIVTQPVVVTPAPTLAPLVTIPTSVAYVTEGASVMVTNASRVDGAAGRLTDRLVDVGFTTVTPGNYVPDQLDVSKIYYVAANTSAKAVADSLYLAFGGGAIEVLELPVPPPVDTGTVGDAGVLVAMGNDIADKSLEELQGLVAPSTTAPPSDTASDDSADSTSPSTSAP